MDEYKKHAKLYDQVVGPFLRSTHGDMVDILQTHGCRTVLDLCCGTGLFIGEAQRAGMIPSGVDLSPAMLSVARNNFSEIEFTECDASLLANETGSYDAVSISFALHEKPREVALAIIHEGRRLVRKGGLLVVADYSEAREKNSFLAGLGIRLVEYMAGKNHNSHFRDYMKCGGSEGFFLEADLPVTRISTHMGGWSGVFFHQVND